MLYKNIKDKKYLHCFYIDLFVNENYNMLNFIRWIIFKRYK